MQKLARGTTPTITMTYKTIDVSLIVEAYLTMRQRGLEIEKTLAEAAVADNSLSWTLTQQETLDLRTDSSVNIQCRYRLQDGTAGTSEIYTVSPYAILKEGVI